MERRRLEAALVTAAGSWLENGGGSEGRAQAADRLVRLLGPGHAPARRFFFREEHLGFLRENYPRLGLPELTRRFNDAFGAAKSESQVHAALKNHGIRCGRKGRERLVERRRTLLTPEQDSFVRREYPGRSLRSLVRRFNDAFGTDLAPAQLRAYVKNHKIRSGRDGRFTAGCASWNKGTRGRTGRNRTTFQKGNVPANLKVLGTERESQGYLLVKVAETNPYTGAPTRYRFKHQVEWEKNHGERVPKGHAVLFADGNTRNFAPDNLLLARKAELSRLNRLGYARAPREVKPSILALARLAVKAFALAREARGKGGEKP